MPHWMLHALEPVQAVCGNWCLHFWEVVGVWFTGLATFSAVLLSLVLARREGVRIRVSASIWQLVEQGRQPPWPEFLQITVRNVGTRRAVIEGVGWRRRPWSRQHAYQTFPDAGGPPATIEPGTAGSFRILLSDPKVKFAEDLLEKMIGAWPRVGVHLVRVVAWTPTGGRCSAFLDSSLKEWLVEKAMPMERAVR